jgi:WD40 repeat protein
MASEPSAEGPPPEGREPEPGSFDGEPVDPGALTWGAAPGGDGATLGGLPGDAPDGPRALPEVPGYDLLRELSRGGMGVVYLARARELERLCALKMILAGDHAGAEAVRRFLAEASAAASLKHPGIVQVYRLGGHDGRPYLELEYLDGGPLTARLDGTPWEPRAAAALLAPVAGAVAEAHRHGLVHRDLKPGNILLDAEGRPKVSDFGLAKLLGQGQGLTATGEILGSPWYMAPEQADGHTREVGKPADVYALGAVLYELLTGRPPFRGATVLETLEQVKSAVPVSPRRLVPSVPRDLETIVLQCLAKGPGQRYPDAGALADDLARYLRGEPVKARPVGPLARFGRWCARNPRLAALEGAVVALLVAIAAVSTTLYVRVHREAHQVEWLNALLKGKADQADQQSRAALESAADAVDALALAREANAAGESARRELDRALYATRTNLALAAHEAGDSVRLASLLALCTPRPGEPDRRGWEYAYLRRLGGEARRVLHGHAREVCALAYSPDGTRLAAAEWGGRIVVRDAATGAVLRELGAPDAGFIAPGRRGVFGLAFRPDGALLAAAGPGHVLALWDVATGGLVRTFEGEPEPLLSVAFAPDGRVVAAGAARGGVRLWDAATGRRLPAPPGGPAGGCEAVAFSPEGDTLAAAGRDVGVLLWDRRRPDAPPRPLGGRRLAARCLAFSPDGATLATGGGDRALRVWDLATGRTRVVNVHGHAQAILALAYSRDGARIATAGADRVVRLWDAATGGSRRAFKGHTESVLAVAFAPDGRTLASAGADHTVALWDPRLPPMPLVLAEPGYPRIYDLAFSPEGTDLATALDPPGVHLWGLAGTPTAPATLQPTAPPAPAAGPTGTYALAYSPDGTTIASGGSDRAITLWDVARRTPLAVLRRDDDVVRALAFHPDGLTLASASDDGRVKLWDVARREERFLFNGQIEGVDDLLFAPSGAQLAAACHDGSVRVLDVATGEVRLTLRGHDGPVRGLAYARDGTRLASAGEDGLVQAWDAATGEMLRTFTGHTGIVSGLAFHPDGTRLASAGLDRTVKLWDLDSGQELLTLEGHTQRVRRLAFSPDGLKLASAGDDGTVRLWDATPLPAGRAD